MRYLKKKKNAEMFQNGKGQGEKKFKFLTRTYIAVVSIKLSIGYPGIIERSHFGCPSGMFDLKIGGFESTRD